MIKYLTSGLVAVDYISLFIYFVSAVFGITVLLKSKCEHAKIFSIMFILNTVLYAACVMMAAEVYRNSSAALADIPLIHNYHNLKALFDLQSAGINILMCLFLLKKENHESS